MILRIKNKHLYVSFRHFSSLYQNSQHHLIRYQLPLVHSWGSVVTLVTPYICCYAAI